MKDKKDVSNNYSDSELLHDQDFPFTIEDADHAILDYMPELLNEDYQPDAE